MEHFWSQPNLLSLVYSCYVFALKTTASVIEKSVFFYCSNAFKSPWFETNKWIARIFELEWRAQAALKTCFHSSCQNNVMNKMIQLRCISPLLKCQWRSRKSTRPNRNLCAHSFWPKVNFQCKFSLIKLIVFTHYEDEIWNAFSQNASIHISHPIQGNLLNERTQMKWVG